MQAPPSPALDGPPRILHLLDHSLPMQSGYAVRSQAILSQQRQWGWQVAALTSPRHTDGGLLQEEIDGIPIFRTPGAGHGASWRNALGVLQATHRRLREVTKFWQPHLLHAHSPFLMGMAALRVGHGLAIPVVYEVRAFWEDAAVCHGTTRYNSPRYRLSRWLETRVMQRARGVVAISQGLRQDILARGIAAAKVVVSGNGALPVAPPPLPRPPAATLGYIGSLYGYEGLALLLRALPHIRRHCPAARVVLVGDGPEAMPLRQLAGQLQLEQVVDFQGSLPGAQARAFYDQIDLCIFPRLSSRLTELVTPLKPLEAMAHRRLVVASDVGGHRELVQQGQTGILFPPGDPCSLGETVLQLLAEPATWQPLLDNATLQVQNQRAWPRQLAATRRLYENLLHGPLPGASPFAT